MYCILSPLIDFVGYKYSEYGNLYLNLEHNGKLNSDWYEIYEKKLYISSLNEYRQVKRQFIFTGHDCVNVVVYAWVMSGHIGVLYL